MDKETKLKIKIAEAAANRYLENNRFTIQSLADELNIKPSGIFDLFPNRSSILRYFYTSRIIKYRDQIKSIEGYQTFSLGEKLSTLHLSLLEQFQDYREFVLITYRKQTASFLQTSEFEAEYKKDLKKIFKEDEKIPATAYPFINRFLFQAVYLQFHGLVCFWKQDQSRYNENSMALIDKWCALTEEVFYSRIPEKGFDLAKFLFYQSQLSKWMSGSSDPSYKANPTKN